MDRLQEIKRRVNVLPLGRYAVHTHLPSDTKYDHLMRLLLVAFSGAIAGTPFDIDRELLRKGLLKSHQINVHRALLQNNFTFAFFFLNIKFVLFF